MEGARRKEFRRESSGEVRDRRALRNTDAPLVSLVLPQDHDPHSPTTQPLRRLIGAGKVAVDRNGVGPIRVPDQVDRGRRHGDRRDPRQAIQGSGDTLGYHRLPVSHGDGAGPHPASRWRRVRRAGCACDFILAAISSRSPERTRVSSSEIAARSIGVSGTGGWETAIPG